MKKFCKEYLDLKKFKKKNILFAPGNEDSIKVTTYQKQMVVDRKTEKQADRKTGKTE